MARADRYHRLQALERIAPVSVAGSAATGEVLDWAVDEYGHLVPWDLGERLHAAPLVSRGAVIVDWILAVTTADPAAGAEIERRLVSAAT